MDLEELVKTCLDPTNVVVLQELYLTLPTHQNVSTSRLAGRTKTVLEMPSVARKRFVSAQSLTKDLTVKAHVPTSSVLLTLSVPCSMENPGACVIRVTNLQVLVFRDVLMSMSVLEAHVEKELFVKTCLELTDVCVQVDSLETPTNNVLENKTRNNAAQVDLVQLENFAAKENVFVREVSKEKAQDSVGILMNVHWPLLKILSVVKMLSVRICLEALTVNVHKGTMEIPLSPVHLAMAMIVDVLHLTV